MSEVLKNKVRKNNYLDIMLCWVLGIYIFILSYAGHLISNATFLILIVDLTYIILNFKKKMNFDVTFILAILFFIVSFINVQVSEGRDSSSLIYVITLLVFALNYLLLKSNPRNVKTMSNIILIISVFFLLGSILQLFSPLTVIEINKTHLIGRSLLSSINSVRSGILVGFTHNTAVNGIYLSILLLYTFITILQSEKRIYKTILYFCLGITLYLLLLTLRRGYMIFIVIIIFYIGFRLNKKMLKGVLLMIGISLLFLIIIFNTEIGEQLLMRFLHQEDFSNGRSAVFIQMINDFLEKPFFGNGIYTTRNEMGLYNGHNIYLQLLSEQGLVGSIPFITILVINFFKTDKLLVKATMKEDKMYLSMAQVFQLLFIMLGFTENPLYDGYPLFIYLIGIIMNNSIKLKKSNI